MNAPAHAVQFASTRDVATAIASLGLASPTAPALAAISRACRADFLAALSACVTRKDPDGAHRQTLSNLIDITAPKTFDALKALGLEAPPDVLVAIARRAPTRFFSALEVASNPAHERAAEARTVVTNMLAAAMCPASPPAPATPQTPGDGAAPASAGQAPDGNDGPVQSQREEEMLADKDFRSAHAYGKSYGLCFNAAVGKHSRQPGIMVDACTVTEANGKRKANWQDAVHIMLDAREVAFLYAVLRKHRRAVEFAAHGPKNDKSFSIERQGAYFFAKVSAKGMGVRAVKIEPKDALAISILCFQQVVLAYPSVPPGEIIALIRTLSSDDAAPAAAAG